MQYWHDKKGNGFKGWMQDGQWMKEKLSDEHRDSMFPHLKKTASFGDRHLDGSQFNQASDESQVKPFGTEENSMVKNKTNARKLAVNVVLGLSKKSETD
jgi:hypothetical protein